MSKYLGFMVAVFLAMVVISAIVAFVRFDALGKAAQLGSSARSRLSGAAAN